MGINLLTGRIGEISTPQPLVPYQGLPDYTKLLEPLADLDKLKKEDEKNKAARFKEIERPKVDGVYDALEPVMQKEVDNYYKMHEDFYRKTQGKTSYEIDTDPELNKMYGDLIRAKGNFNAEQLKALSGQLNENQKTFTGIDEVSEGYDSDYLLFRAGREAFESGVYNELDPEYYKNFWGKGFSVGAKKQGSMQDRVKSTNSMLGYNAGSQYGEQLADSQIVNGKLVVPKIGGGQDWRNNAKQIEDAINSDIDALMTDNSYKTRNLHEYLNERPVSLEELAKSSNDENTKKFYAYLQEQIGNQPVYFSSLNDVASLLFRTGLGRQPQYLDAVIQDIDRYTQDDKYETSKNKDGKEEKRLVAMGRRTWNAQKLLINYAPAAESSFGTKQNVGLQGFGDDATYLAPQVPVIEQITVAPAGAETRGFYNPKKWVGNSTTGGGGSTSTYSSAIFDKNTYNKLNTALKGSTKGLLSIGDQGLHSNVDLPPGVTFENVNNSFGFIDHPGEGNTTVIFDSNGKSNVSLTDKDKKEFALLEKSSNGRLNQSAFNKLSSDKRAKYALYLYQNNYTSREEVNATDEDGNPLRYNKFNAYGQDYYIPQALVARTTVKIPDVTIKAYENDPKYKAFFDTNVAKGEGVGYVYITNKLFDPRNLNR